MTAFRINEGETEFPKGWEDRTINVLSFPIGSKKPAANLTITRQLLYDDSTLSAYIDRQLAELAKTCPRFSLISREHAQVDGKPAERVLYTWRSQDGVVLKQEQTIVLLASGLVLVFTATASKDVFHLHADAFRGLVENFHFTTDLS